MIQVEIKVINNTEFKYTYSDSNKKILQKETGIKFDDALDSVNSNYTYKELDEDIEE